ncbi:MAG: UvrD-helicase domain-containing protein, partial [Thermoanaerobaculia bacterium]|nr:UvrD-helicase domain-containing protein [Thermoanaerobaculia bacterium]
MIRTLEPRPRILDEVPSTGHLILEASAGTGKTYALEHLVIELLVEGEVELSELLVVTFTERATEELRSRLRRRLRQLTRAGDESLKAAGWSLDEEQRRLLDESLARLDDLHISTIHGFCQGLLHDLAFRHRRLFQQELVDGERLLRRAFREELRETLGGETRRAEALTRVLREGNTVDDLEDRVTKICRFRGDGITPIWDPEGIGRWVEDALSLLRRSEVRESLEQDASEILSDRTGLLEELPDSADPLAVGAAWLEAECENPTSGARKRLRERGDRWSLDLLDTFEALDERAGDPAELVASAFRQSVLDRARERKATRGWYDFDDMLELVAEALRRPDDQVASEVRDRYRYALIDEFQDTDPVQWEIFRRLFPPEAEKQRLVLIGDPKQAIYGFRNADIAVYQRALNSIRDDGGSIHALTRNFRSTPRMLEAQVLLFRDFFDGDTGFAPPEPGRPELSLTDSQGREAPPVVLLRPYTTGSRKLGNGRFNQTVARAIGREIRRIVDGGELRMADGAGEPRAIPFGEIQVLARSNREVETVARALRSARIPYTLYRQEGLFDTEEARHLHELLRAISRPHDGAAHRRAWLTPFFHLPLAQLPGARETKEDHPLRDRLAVWRRQAEEEPLTVLFRSLLRDSGLTRRLLFSDSGHRRLTNYQHLLEILAEEAHGAALGLSEIVSLLADFRAGRARPARSEGTVQRVEGEREAVQVLT